MSTEIFSDIETMFERNPQTGDLLRTVDENSIKTSIKNLILLETYDKVFQPDLFCGLRSELFEPLNPITGQRIRTKIEDIIEKAEPRIERFEVYTEPDYDNNAYKVQITFLPRKFLVEVSLEFFIERAL